ncbi:hypothetical protein FDI24_gp239 [Acidovorax phage ACP17]|uniref:Uncharacterized protein n=1 Tax=Acidovorax phage ACP17 TaxID=2010329 RepID=A0A218M389_9CAUD|nr:hypothetical protein FDI24_gp239 [Acidovorax phage ACP17]ASD50520.1 hypothetical protein [Acidovorax phage ACP17]
MQVSFSSGIETFQKRLTRDHSTSVFRLLLAGVGFAIFAFYPANVILGTMFFIPLVIPCINSLLYGDGSDGFYEDFDGPALEQFCEKYEAVMAAKGIPVEYIATDLLTLTGEHASGDAENTYYSIMHMINKLEAIDGLQDIQQGELPPMRASEEDADGPRD